MFNNSPHSGFRQTISFASNGGIHSVHSHLHGTPNYYRGYVASSSNSNYPSADAFGDSSYLPPTPYAEPVRSDSWGGYQQSEPVQFVSLFSPQECLPVPVNYMASVPSESSVPITADIANLEEKLVKFHSEGRLGSIDIDNYSEQLLALKRNYNAMLSGKASLSPRQEVALRHDLNLLSSDIQRQACSF